MSTIDKEFSSEPIVAWRHWNTLSATDDNGSVYLMNANRHHIWTPYKRATAECKNEWNRHKENNEVVPVLGCSCGLYAVKSAELLFEHRQLQFGVYGEVYLWGKVIETEIGYKAQFAYPKSLYIVDKNDRTNDCLPLSIAYGVPCMYEPWSKWKDIYDTAADEFKPMGAMPPKRAARRSPKELLRRELERRDQVMGQIVTMHNMLAAVNKEIKRLELALKPIVEL